MVKISVIMPVYNDEDNLRRSIESVINQSLKDIELICVDDGSEDNSLNILKDFSKLDDRIIVLNQENQGSGSARNHGMNHAKGEYVAFLDSDDYIISSDAFSCLYHEAKNKNMDMVSGRIQFISKTGTSEEFLCFKPIKEINIKKVDDYGLPWYFYKNIFKRSFLIENDIKFIDLLRGQDPVFFTEILSKLEYYLEVPILYYAYHTPSGVNKINDSLKYYDYVVHYYEVFKILMDDEKFKNMVYEYSETLFQFSNNEVFVDDENQFYSLLNVLDGLSLLYSNFGDKQLFTKLYESLKRIISKVEIDNFDISISPICMYNLFSKNIVARNISFKPKLSLILCIHNSEESLKVCLDSLINQSFKDIEIICIDFDSKDNTLDILKEYKKRDTRVNIFSQRYDGHEINIDDNLKAHGEYVNFINVNYYEPNFCENIFNYNNNVVTKKK